MVLTAVAIEGCNVVYPAENQLTSRKIVSPPSSGLMSELRKKKGGIKQASNLGFQRTARRYTPDSAVIPV